MKQFHNSTDKPPKADKAGLFSGLLYYPQRHY